MNDFFLKKGRDLSWWLFLKLIFVIFVIFVPFFVLIYNVRPIAYGEESREEIVLIEPGYGVKDVADDLWSKNLIRSKYVFIAYSTLRGLSSKFLPGEYKISSSWDISQIIGRFLNGPADIDFVIKEGESLADIDESLYRAKILKRGDLLTYKFNYLKYQYPFLREADSLEGFLFPDTYKFSQFSNIDVVVREFLNNFQNKAWPSLKKEGIGKAYDFLKIASLIEKEVPHSKDRPLIAGVIMRRMKLGMPLQLDASTAYEKCGKRFFTCNRGIRDLRSNDLKKDGQYNLYTNKGLPPTPISNPSLDSIIASLNAKKTEFLFYISDPKTKKTIFSRTFEEHKNNVRKYLK